MAFIRTIPHEQAYYHMINRLFEALGTRHKEERLRGEVGSALPWHVPDRRPTDG